MGAWVVRSEPRSGSRPIGTGRVGLEVPVDYHDEEAMTACGLTVLDGEGEPGPGDAPVRDFTLIEGEGMNAKRTQKPDVLDAFHAAELERLERVYQVSLASIDRRYKEQIDLIESRRRGELERQKADLTESLTKAHNAEIERLMGIIDKLIAKVGPVE